MKKYYFIAAAAITLASCASDEFTGEVPNVPVEKEVAISFDGAAANITRANRVGADAAADMGNNFVVVGFKGSATTAANTTNVFDHYNVNYVANTSNSTTTNTAGWEYVGQNMKVKGAKDEQGKDTKLSSSATVQTIKFWDHAAASYDFLAFSVGKGKTVSEATTYAQPTAVKSSTLSTAAYTLTGDEAELSECYISDITTVKEADYNANAINMNFRHLTSKVRMALYETIPGYVVKDVKFHEEAKTTHVEATATNATLFGASAFNVKGTATVYFPTTGTDNSSNADYNKAHVKIAPDASNGTASKKTLSAVKYGNAAEDAITAGTTYLGQTSSAASYCGTGTDGKEYATILPNEEQTKTISIQIDYTLVATDGGTEEIKVYGAKADVPAKFAAWKPGYAYTYIFKISQNTNGHTGSSVDDKGLTALSFDAVVMDDQEGVQETITNMETAGITTYQKGAVASANDEYKAGDIYVVVNGGTALSADNAKLYTAVAEANSLQGVTEASVANCLKNYTGVTASEAATQTVTTGADVSSFYTLDSGVYYKCASGAVAADGVTYYSISSDKITGYVVKDAAGKKLTVTVSAALTTGVTKIPGTAAPDGNDVTINCGKIAAVASTIYVFEYNNSGAKTYKVIKVGAGS